MKKITYIFIFFSSNFIFSFAGLAQEKSNYYYANAKEFIRIDSLNLALIELDSATQLAPTFEDAYFLKGQIRERQKEYRKAIGQYSLAILHNPNFSEAYIKRASLHFNLKDHRNYVLNDINEAIRIQPNNAELHALKAYYYASTLSPEDLKPDYKNAIIAINDALVINPKEANYYYTRSNYKLKSEQKLSSLLDINKAIEMSSKVDEFYHHRSVIKFTMGDFNSALKDINKAIEIKNRLALYHQLRGNIHYNLKKYDNAYNDYSVSINLLFQEIYKTKTQIASNHTLNIKLRQTLLLRGMALVQENKPFDGCEDFKRALKMGERKANNYIRQYCK